MNYQETLDWLYLRLPMFTRQGASAYKKDLSNTLALCQALDNPQHKFRAVHVAGTNGKGSVSNFLASIFQVAGYRTGLYTSPHLLDFRERIRINGEMIPEVEVVAFVEKNQALMDTVQPSFFEATVAMAFDYFARQHVDIAIVEVGLGGRLDSTNVITPDLSIITGIGFDHMDLLGDTLERIAAEKAGIIKPGIPVVAGEMDAGPHDVIREVAQENNSPFIYAPALLDVQPVHVNSNWEFAKFLEVRLYAGSDFVLNDIESGLVGTYQAQNIETLLSSIEQLQAKGWRLPIDVVLKGIREVRQQTGFRGRMECLGQHPLVITDIAHNTQGIQAVMTQLQIFPARRWHIVLGMVRDKDRSKLWNLFPEDAHYYYVRPDLPRAIEADVLALEGNSHGRKGNSYENVERGVQEALKSAEADDLIYIGGSTFVVAEALGMPEFNAGHSR